jgi:hypothetical protein
VYFFYSVEINSDQDEFTAAAHADIDNDDDPQYWGYRKGGQDGKDHSPYGQCVAGAGGLTVPETVMPCTTASGQSVF